MFNRKFLIIGFLAAALVLAFACGGGDSNDNADETPGSQATEVPDDTGDEPGDIGDSGSGSATLTIGSEAWTVENVFCAFSPEDAGNERVSFSMSGFSTTADGVRIQFDATIQDTEEQGRYEGDGVIHSITIDDIDDFENPAVGWSSVTGLFGDSVDIIQVDGKSVTAETVFDNTLTDDVIEEIPGTLAGTCP